MVTNNLENKLVETLDKMMEGVGQGVDFMSAQLPDYIEQLLTWFMIYNLTLFIIGLAIPVIIYKVSKRVLKKCSDDGWWFDSEFIGFMGIILTILLLLISLELINLQWLQILVAPKVWLVEYILQLKGG